MLTVTADQRMVEAFADHLVADDDLIDRLLPKDPWFHSNAYLESAYCLLRQYLTSEWRDGQDDPVLHLHGAPAGALIEVAVDLIGPEQHEQTLGGIVYLDLPRIETIRLALPTATRDTDVFSASHLYEPPAQITHVIGALCSLVDRALAPVSSLLTRAA